MKKKQGGNKFSATIRGFCDKKADERRMTGAEPKEQALPSNVRFVDNLKEQAALMGGHEISDNSTA